MSSSRRNRTLPAWASNEYLAAGGSAIIYAIDDQKVLKQYDQSDEGWQSRKEREYRALMRLSPHQNIVQLFAEDETGIVLERGESLRNVLKQSILLPVADRISYATQAAIGLCHIHDNGIVHADFGPHNMILIDDRLAIIDFEGCLIDGDNLKGGACYEWCSYRPFRDDSGVYQVNITTDIFAFGCTLYELMTGRQPHHDLIKDPAHRMSYAHLRWENSEYPDVSGLPLREVIMGCWESQFGSMKEVVDALDEVHGSWLRKIFHRLSSFPGERIKRRGRSRR